jgi:hypothetical protein
MEGRAMKNQDPNTTHPKPATVDVVIILAMMVATIGLCLVIALLLLARLLAWDMNGAYVANVVVAAVGFQMTGMVCMIGGIIRLPRMLKNDEAIRVAKDQVLRERATKAARLKRMTVYPGNRKFGDSMLDYIE